MMRTLPLRYGLALGVIFMTAACTQTGFQLKKDSAETVSLPDCSKNYSREMSFSDGWEYKTWVRYDDTDFKKASDAAEWSIRKMGYRVVRAERDSGRITAEKVNGSRPQAASSIHVKIEKEDRVLVVYLSLKAPRGTIDASTLCSFYADFEKEKSRAGAESPPRAVLVSPEKAREDSTATKLDRSSSPDLQPFSGPPPPSPLPSSSGPRRTAHVKWQNVNLREGPGMSFKVVGNIAKGTALSILDEKGQWLHIRTGEGKEAWIYKPAMSEEGANSPSPSSPPAQKPRPAKVASPM